MTHQYCEDANISLAATGATLLALEEEIKMLQREMEMCCSKMGLAMQKVDICRAALVKSVKSANGGVYPKAPLTMQFPELSHIG